MKKQGICSVFLLLIFTLNPSPTLSADDYTPIDSIVVDCGSTTPGSNTADDRSWDADNPSKFLQPGSESASSTPTEPSTRLEKVPYLSARWSRSNFTYSFPVNPGQKFIRLYFFPATYSPDFNKSAASFSVAAGQFALLDSFIPDLHPLSTKEDGFQLEFCLNVNPNQQRLNLTFSPTPGAYAFVNGIEVVSMPTNLYYSNADAGLNIIGNGNQQGSIRNDTALQLMYRIDVAGQGISPDGGTGMYRQWSPDDEYLDSVPLNSIYSNGSIQLQYRNEIHKLVAPATVYRTARGMSNISELNLQYNLTWSFPVDPSFTYFVRLHFCEIQPPVNARDNRAFWIYIANRTTGSYTDVIQEAGGNGFPMFKDYLVRIEAEEEKKQLPLFVALRPFQENSAFYNSILNGAEIYKLSRSGSLAGPNPDRPPNPSSPDPSSSPSTSSPTRLILIVAGGVVLGLAVVSLLLFFVFRRKRNSKSSSSYIDGGSASKSMLPYSSFPSTNETSKDGSSNLPSELCRRFSLSEIKSATGFFDDNFIIGVGGFGDVYKGLINFNGGGGATTVAIKRLKQGSQQGANEFRTEIEMLSQLRHRHLVSLIGYCYDDEEMILVYDYMSHGTLRDHLYSKSQQISPSIPWKQRLEICIGAAHGLHYLHSGASNTIIHRDVKTTNILLDENWVAKVSDFGLSKIGPAAGAANAHVSTVVKGSFGYLDPEYYRLQRLTEKSDVYSFGIVLWEVLTARPPVNRAGGNDKRKMVSLAELARQCCKKGRVAEIVDRDLDGEIAPECLKKFAEVAMSCLVEKGVDRPSMGDVVWGLEFAKELQCGSEERVKLLASGGGGEGGGDGIEEMRGGDSSSMQGRKSSGGSSMFTTNSEIDLGSGVNGMMVITSGTMTSVEESSTNHEYSEDSLLGSNLVFSEILDPKAR
ncbi:unnamed protein product [Linum tenue]|uniref:Protein kinase domain-containing protein n=2 Tax=Linum tenue TaxID=586396 RepID=A0AAV0HSN5_9ROSI|nr:unnamed protein product [Linum tenue]